MSILNLSQKAKLIIPFKNFKIQYQKCSNIGKLLEGIYSSIIITKLLCERICVPWFDKKGLVQGRSQTFCHARALDGQATQTYCTHTHLHMDIEKTF